MTERERRALLRRRPDVTSWRELLEYARNQYESFTYEVPVQDSHTEYAPTVERVTEIDLGSPPSVVTEIVKCCEANYEELILFLIRAGISYQNANSIAQATFIQAYKQLGQAKPSPAQLRRTAITICQLDKLSAEAIQEHDQSLLPELVSAGNTSAVLKALPRLPPQQRLILAWAIDGFSPAEIAIGLGFEARDVSENLKHARETLWYAILSLRGSPVADEYDQDNADALRDSELDDILMEANDELASTVGVLVNISSVTKSVSAQLKIA